MTFIVPFLASESWFPDLLYLLVDVSHQVSGSLGLFRPPLFFISIGTSPYFSFLQGVLRAMLSSCGLSSTVAERPVLCRSFLHT